MRIFVLFSLLGCLLFIGCGEKSSDSITLPLNDADVEQLLKEAVDVDSLEERGDLRCQVNESEPYSGWAKMMYNNGVNPAHLGRKRNLTQYKGGKPTFAKGWYPNGQKAWESTYKDGDGLHTAWHENGQKQWREETYMGKLVSAKYWNSKGEEVESEEDSRTTHKDGELVFD